MPTILVIHHSPGVELGWLGEVFAEAGLGHVELALDTIVGLQSFNTLVQEGVEAIKNHDISAIVVLGGFMSAYDEESYEFLRTEVEWLRAIATRQICPILGLCLGFQLLAMSAGMRVRDLGKECGFIPLRLTDAGRKCSIIGRIKDGQKVVSYHNDSVSLDEANNNITVLAYSDRGFIHAFQFGSGLGMQFHPEASPQMVLDWMRLLRDESDESKAYISSIMQSDSLESESKSLFFAWIEEDLSPSNS